MELKIIIENQNDLFNRKEIEGEIKSQSAPSREEMRKILAEKYSIGEDTIKIRTIKGAYGSQTFLLAANIYKTKEDKDKFENTKKKDLESEKRAAEAKATSEKLVEQPSKETSFKDESVSEEKSIGESKEETKSE